jgi:hypothetical protein
MKYSIILLIILIGILACLIGIALLYYEKIKKEIDKSPIISIGKYPCCSGEKCISTNPD